MKIGVFGGCFNPPHKGHYEIVNYLLENGYINKGMVVPANDNYNKLGLVSYDDRINMLNILFKDMNNVIVSNVERDKKMFSYEVLDYYRNLYPEDQIYYILGSDNLKEFKTWKNYQYILENYYILVIERNNDTSDILKNFFNYLDRIIYIEQLKIDCSSTKIREEIKHKKAITLLEDGIKDYINKNNLYCERG